MKNYELNCLISPEISEEEARGLLQKINDFILKEKGEIKNTTAPFKIKLAYSINKKGEAFLSVLNFGLEPLKLVELEKNLKTENQIIRYLILTKEPQKEILRKQRATKRAPKISEKTKEEKTETSKVKLEEIDKKIEEILKN